MTIAGCDRVALGVQVVSSSEAHHLWRVWKICSEENVESDVHRPRKGGVRQRISPSKASKGDDTRAVCTGEHGGAGVDVWGSTETLLRQRPGLRARHQHTSEFEPAYHRTSEVDE